MSNNTTDRELIIAYAAGDRDSGDLLISRYIPLVWRVMRSLEGFEIMNYATRDELLQTGRIAIMNAALHFDTSSGKPFFPYVRRAIKNACFDVLEDIYRSFKDVELDTLLGSVSEPEVPSPSPVDAAIVADRNDRLYMLLRDNLTAEEYAFVMDYRDGYTGHALAVRHGMTDKKADNTLQAIKRKLSVLLRK